MRNGIRLCAVAFAVLAGACGDGGTGPAEEELTGTWRATKMEFVSVSNPAQKVDVITLGVTATLALNAGGTFFLTSTEPGHSAETLSGTWSASADVLTLKWTTPFTGEWQFDMALSGGSLTLSGADAEYNIDGVGGDDPAVPLRAQSAPAAQEPALRPVVLDSALLITYRWRNIGPDRGGRSIAVSGVRGRPAETYFGAAGGGLWKTTDGGNSCSSRVRHCTARPRGRTRRVGRYSTPPRCTPSESNMMTAAPGRRWPCFRRSRQGPPDPKPRERPARDRCPAPAFHLS